MAKRFTDTSLWRKEWFMALEPAYKCAFMYVKDECNQIGVWDTNFRLAEFTIKADIDWEKLLEQCNGNIEILENGKWWLVDFCSFQYGELTESSPPHRKYIQMLKEAGLYERVMKGYQRGNTTPQEEEEDKEEDKEEDSKGGDLSEIEKLELQMRKGYERREGQLYRIFKTEEREQLVTLLPDYGYDDVLGCWNFMIDHKNQFISNGIGSISVGWFFHNFNDILSAWKNGQQKPDNLTWKEWWEKVGYPDDAGS